MISVLFLESKHGILLLTVYGLSLFSFYVVILFKINLNYIICYPFNLGFFYRN